MKSCAARWAADTVASQEIKPSATPSVRPGTTSRPRGRLFVWDYLLALWVKARWLGDDPCQRAATYRKPAPAVLCPQPCPLPGPKGRPRGLLLGHRAAGPPPRPSRRARRRGQRLRLGICPATQGWGPAFGKAGEESKVPILPVKAINHW